MISYVLSMYKYVVIAKTTLVCISGYCWIFPFPMSNFDYSKAPCPKQCYNYNESMAFSSDSGIDISHVCYVLYIHTVTNHLHQQLAAFSRSDNPVNNDAPLPLVLGVPVLLAVIATVAIATKLHIGNLCHNLWRLRGRFVRGHCHASEI